MKVEVVAVGTELLLGQIVDTNSSWIGEQLAVLEPLEQVVVGHGDLGVDAAEQLARCQLVEGVQPHRRDDLPRRVHRLVLVLVLFHLRPLEIAKRLP